MAPLANNMGLFVATPSYNGRIAFSLISDRAIMPDIAVFRECIHASFADLLAAAPQAGHAKAPQLKPQADGRATNPAQHIAPTIRKSTVRRREVESRETPWGARS